ncbi:nucleotide pyrophosphatase/phosphodiesterase family protein [Tistrella mobilis]
MRFLLIGLDGLRPELVTHDRMPVLTALLERGTVLARHSAAFPTETYVNLPTLVTGARPSGHGMVANFFLDPRVDARERFEGYDVAKIEKATAAYDGRLFTTPTLGEILAANGRRLKVLSANSAGSVRLKQPMTGLDALCLSVHQPESSFPEAEVRAILDEVGRPEAPKQYPDLAGTRWMTDAFLTVITRDLPDVTILWYGEPDNAYHVFGIGSETSLGAMRAVDDQIGRVADWWEAEGRAAGVQLIFVSDHAHVTQTRRFDLAAALRSAGFRVDRHLADGADVALIPGYCGNMLVRDRSPALAAKVAAALMEMDEIGMVFSAPGRDGVEGQAPGTFDRRLAGIDHARAADLVFVLRNFDEPDQWGLTGTCLHDNGLGDGVGIHGGLHPKEILSLGALVGDRFRSGARIETATGTADIVPTMLAMMGLEHTIAPGPHGGRPVWEAMTPADGSAMNMGRNSRIGYFSDRHAELVAEPETVQSLTVGTGRFAQRLDRRLRGGRAHIEAGRRIG